MQSQAHEVFSASQINSEHSQNETRICKTKSALSRLKHEDSQRMSRMLGYCLTNGALETWEAFRMVASARMAEADLAKLAYFTLTSLDPEVAERTAATAIRAHGRPLPAFLCGMSDARGWAEWASPGELKAYALAAFEAMPARDQAAFLAHASKAQVAA